MKIIFKENIPDIIDKHFALYHHDEALGQNAWYIDIRKIVREKTLPWLDDIQLSYSRVGGFFLYHTRWWWATPMSRLDARPWGQERLLKPFLFARAVLEWQKFNPELKEIVLIGCDPLVAVYLREFDRGLVLEGGGKSPVFFIFQAVKHSFKAVLRLFKAAYGLTKYHVFKSYNKINIRTIILYQRTAGGEVSSGYKYFYGSIFDSINKTEPDAARYVCIDGIGFKRRGDTGKEAGPAFLLDNINFWNLFSGIIINIRLIFWTWIIAWRRPACGLNGAVSSWFWFNYLFCESSRAQYLMDICCYHGLRAIFRRNSSCKAVIYPYEEKALERAVLFACQEYNIKSIGYTPHPQHALALSLRDVYPPLPPKPLNYAVCGELYVDYFTDRCKKSKGSISVWGSEKSYRELNSVKIPRDSHLKILLLLSHPEELRVFHTWLKTDKRLVQDVTYSVRIYKEGNYKEFESILSLLMKEFNCVQEVIGQLDENLKDCDLAVFCATSAGLIAINQGYLSLYLDLNDFFQINPCFDELSTMLECETAGEFGNRLGEIRKMDAAAIKELHAKQIFSVLKIFSPVRTDAIRKELRG